MCIDNSTVEEALAEGNSTQNNTLKKLKGELCGALISLN
jgi:hypothetical protein